MGNSKQSDKIGSVEDADHLECVNKVIHGDCLMVMKKIKPGSVDCIITSPPYNVGKEYEEQLTLEEYLKFIEKFIENCYVVLKDGGRICINVGNMGRSPYIPLTTYFNNLLLKHNFLMRGEIIWNKSASVGSSTAWGSWKSPSNPCLRDTHEYLLMFSKQDYKHTGDKSMITISKDQFMEYTKSIWNMSTERSRVHPAPFPVELPMRVIQLYSFEGDIVLDPFAGSGTTGIACKEAGRNYILIEKEKKYIDVMHERGLE